MNSRLAISIGLLLMISLPLRAEVFKCTDPSGMTIFKDSECEGEEVLVDKIEIETSKSPSPKSRKRNLFDLSNNLIKNGDFSKEMLHWQPGERALWSISQGSARAMAYAAGGEMSSLENVMTQCVNIGEYSKFNFGAQFRAESLPLEKYTARLEVVWYDGEDCKGGGEYGGYIEPKDKAGWQPVFKQGFLPRMGAKSVVIRLIQHNTKSTPSINYWDDLYLVPTETAPPQEPDVTQQAEIRGNLLKNGSFDFNLNDWHTGWDTRWTSVQGGDAKGAARVLMTSDKGGIGMHALTQCVDLDGGKKYEIGSSVLKDPGSTQKSGGRLRVSWYENRACKGRSRIGKWVDPTSEPGWQRLQFTSDRPPMASSATVSIIESIEGVGRAVSYWDDVYIKAIEQP